MIANAATMHTGFNTSLSGWLGLLMTLRNHVADVIAVPEKRFDLLRVSYTAVTQRLVLTCSSVKLIPLLPGL